MTRIFEELVHEITSHTHHPRYHQPDSTTAPEAPVSLLDTIRSEVAAAVTWGEDEFRKALPTIAKAADYAEAVAASEPAKVILGAVLSPADEAIIVGLVQRLDKAADQAAAAEAPAEAPAEVPVDSTPDVPADLQPVPAGPVVGGQAQ